MRRRLLRAKALSLMYEHPRCPILFKLARRYIDLTCDVNPMFEKSYWSARLIDQLDEHKEEVYRLNEEGPSFTARSEFADIYGISLVEQFEIEAYIEGCQVHELTHDAINQLFVGPSFDDVYDYSRKCVVSNG